MLLELDTQAWKRVVQVPRMVSNMGRRSWRRSGMRMRIWWSLSQVSWLQKATVSWSDGKCIQRNGLTVYITTFLVLTWKWWYYLNLMKLLLDPPLEIDIIAGENNNTYFWWAIHMCQFFFEPDLIVLEFPFFSKNQPRHLYSSASTLPTHHSRPPSVFFFSFLYFFFSETLLNRVTHPVFHSQSRPLFSALHPNW